MPLRASETRRTIDNSPVSIQQGYVPNDVRPGRIHDVLHPLLRGPERMHAQVAGRPRTELFGQGKLGPLEWRR